jgi:protein gp37
LRDQCVDADVPFFFKQWGDWAPWDGDNWECPGGWDDVILHEGAWSIDKEGRTYQSQYKNITVMNDQIEIVKVGKKCAGRLLDGREWNGMPK